MCSLKSDSGKSNFNIFHYITPEGVNIPWLNQRYMSYDGVEAERHDNTRTTVKRTVYHRYYKRIERLLEGLSRLSIVKIVQTENNEKWVFFHPDLLHLIIYYKKNSTEANQAPNGKKTKVNSYIRNCDSITDKYKILNDFGRQLIFSHYENYLLKTEDLKLVVQCGEDQKTLPYTIRFTDKN